MPIFQKSVEAYAFQATDEQKAALLKKESVLTPEGIQVKIVEKGENDKGEVEVKEVQGVLALNGNAVSVREGDYVIVENGAPVAVVAKEAFEASHSEVVAKKEKAAKEEAKA